MDSATMLGIVVAFTDDTILSLSALKSAMSELGYKGDEQCDPQIITQASSLSRLPMESSSVDTVISISRSLESPSGDSLVVEVLRVLKPGGTILVYKSLPSVSGEIDKEISALERKLFLAGFLEAKCLQLKLETPTNSLHSIGVKAKKPSWKIGSSFSLKKKPLNNTFKLQFEDNSDLIDEDSLLTEEDLKKPQLPTIGDCEVGSTKKACKNCSCGRAEEEEKVLKLGLTVDQIDNPQSACGSCGLGDAFRCGTCPYKGLPPFKLGEKVSLSANFLTADI